ncbi:MAG: adenylosuccinate lyase, partial [Bdellovibrionota bacterium]
MNRSETDQLYSLSAIDGRYRSKLESLSPIVSEAGLIRYRIRVEAEWLLHLSESPAIDFKLSAKAAQKLAAIAREVSSEGLLRVKDFEKTTNHDVKAVEYYLREVLEGEEARTHAFIHFA